MSDIGKNMRAFLLGLAIFLFVALMMIPSADASNKMNMNRDGTRVDVDVNAKAWQQQQQQVKVKQNQTLTSNVTNTATGGEAVAYGGAATSMIGDTTGGAGGSVTMNSRGGNDTVYVPNNNTESCLRVFGFAIPTKDGAIILGWPWRSQPCDLEAAADDAFSQGLMALGWSFKCKQKSLIKAFESEEQCNSVTTATLDLHGELQRVRESNRVLLEERKHDLVELRDCRDSIGRCETALKGEDK